MDEHGFELAGQFLQREAGRGGAAARDHVDAAGFDPLAGLDHGNVGLVLVVRDNDLDGLAQHRAAEVIDRHAHRLDLGHAADIGVDARQVGNHADPHRTVGDLRHACTGQREAQRQKRQQGEGRASHTPR